MAKETAAIPAPAGPQVVVTEWAGHPNYGCPFCSYATLGDGQDGGEDMVTAHMVYRHADELRLASLGSVESETSEEPPAKEPEAVPDSLPEKSKE